MTLVRTRPATAIVTDRATLGNNKGQGRRNGLVRTRPAIATLVPTRPVIATLVRTRPAIATLGNNKGRHGTPTPSLATLAEVLVRPTLAEVQETPSADRVRTRARLLAGRLRRATRTLPSSEAQLRRATPIHPRSVVRLRRAIRTLREVTTARFPVLAVLIRSLSAPAGTIPRTVEPGFPAAAKGSTATSSPASIRISTRRPGRKPRLMPSNSSN